jgi:hypothetical protein
MNLFEKLESDYYLWLKHSTDLVVDEETGWTQISTPFSDLFNDPIEIYAKSKNGKIMLSDDGMTSRNLLLSGVSISRSKKRKEILEKVLLNYGVKYLNDELLIEATVNDFPQKKHNLLSSIIEVNDMYMLAEHTIASVFKEDVKNYLEENSIIYTPQFIAKGATGLEFTFDFLIAYRRKEIVLKTFNRLNAYNLTHFLFTWADIKEAREKISGKAVSGLAIINNKDRNIKPELLEAISAKKADFMLWSERNLDEGKKKLTA